MLPGLVIASLLPLLAAAASYKQGRSDSRCFLENGGSGENFFASEDLALGSLIGTLRVNGNTGEKGDISLRLEESDSPVRIEPGTKNLTLIKKLDKEGENGISSVFVHVLCSPLGDSFNVETEPIKIPVNIRVTDVNDNAPQFENGPYILNISEVTVVGTRVLQGVRARDNDQPGPFSTVQYIVQPGPNSDHFVFANGLEGTLVLRKPLDYETLPNFTLTIRAQDQGTPPQYTDTLLYVNVIDADDQNPKFEDERYSAIVPDHATEGTRLRIQPRDIAAFDQDVGIRSPIIYSFNSAGSDYKYFEIDKITGHVSLKRNIPEDELLQPATLVVKAEQTDNRDRYALATLSVSRPGTSLRELQFLQSHYVAGVLENVPLNSVLLSVITNRHRDKKLRFTIDNHTDMFTVSPSGDVILKKHLDYESQDNYLFQVYATDGIMNASASINITVLNVNDWDPRFRFPQYEFFVPEVGEGQTPVGRVEAADGDRGDHVTLSLQGPSAKMFSIDEIGIIKILDLSALNSSTVHLVAVATDTGIPPRQASVPVIIHLPEAVIWRSGVANNMIMMAAFGGILGVLAIVILALIIYIQKHKQPKAKNQLGSLTQNIGIESEKLPPMNSETTLTLSHSENNNLNGGLNGALNGTLRRMNGTMNGSMNGTMNGTLERDSHRNDNMTFGSNIPKNGKIENPMFANINPTLPNSSAQYTATVKSIMSRNGISRGPAPPGSGVKKSAPIPPQLPVGPSPPQGFRGWPAGSIPRTVKKLSWDDDSTDSAPTNNRTEMDPDVSVTPLSDAKPPENMNLTVYF